MGYFDADAKAMLDIYRMETGQLVSELNRILMEAEKADHFKRDEINSIFRVMHTIKSSSAMMGLESLADMAHKIEDLFAVLRDETCREETRYDDVFELLYGAADAIEKELDAMTEEDYTPLDVTGLEKQASQCIAEIQKKLAEQHQCTENEEVDQEQPDILKKNGVILKVRFEEGSRMENVRAFMIIRQVKEICGECTSYPEEPEKNPESAEYIKNHGFFLCIDGEEEAVLKAIHGSLFVQSCEIAADNRTQPPAPKEERTDSPKEGLKDSAKDSLKDSPKEGQEEGAAGGRREKLGPSYLNVRLDKLDKLQMITSELFIAISSLDNALEENGLGLIQEQYGYQIEQLINELENTVIHMRMVPLGAIVPKIQRILRDICKAQGKEAELSVTGEDTEADKNVVDKFSEAALHLIRNAMDHGIEMPQDRINAGKSRSGRISIDFQSLGNELVVKFSDDGNGIDVQRVLSKAEERGLLKKKADLYTEEEALDLVLLPGFSTRNTANEFSGRGVGLDVVKKVMDDMGGHLYIESEKGQGSAFTMHFPSTLATMNCVRFCVGEQIFSLPSNQILKFYEYKRQKENLMINDGKLYFVSEDKLLPVISMRKYLGLTGEFPEESVMLHVKGIEHEVCMCVDVVLAKERIVLKPLPALWGEGFRRETGINACSVMGDGRISLALDVEITAKKYMRSIKNGI